MLRVLEFLPIEYDQLGIIRARSGNSSQYAAPGNIYRTRDDRYASIAAFAQTIFERLCKALDLEHLLADSHFIAREAIASVADSELGRVKMQGVVPRFSETPGTVRHAGPAQGEHNLQVWREAGFTDEQIAFMAA